VSGPASARHHAPSAYLRSTNLHTLKASQLRAVVSHGAQVGLDTQGSTRLDRVVLGRDGRIPEARVLKSERGMHGRAVVRHGKHASKNAKCGQLGSIRAGDDGESCTAQRAP